jgi:hypothetical protein
MEVRDQRIAHQRAEREEGSTTRMMKPAMLTLGWVGRPWKQQTLIKRTKWIMPVVDRAQGFLPMGRSVIT